jgi:hypothetical protein
MTHVHEYADTARTLPLPCALSACTFGRGGFGERTGRMVETGRVSEASQAIAHRELSEAAERIRIRDAGRTERVRTDELAEGDVIEHSSGARETVTRLGERKLIGASLYRWVEVTSAEDGSTGSSFWSARSRWDRLTESEKARLGYPTAEHDVPSVREPRVSEDDVPRDAQGWRLDCLPNGAPSYRVLAYAGLPAEATALRFAKAGTPLIDSEAAWLQEQEARHNVESVHSGRPGLHVL